MLVPPAADLVTDIPVVMHRPLHNAVQEVKCSKNVELPVSRAVQIESQFAPCNVSPDVSVNEVWFVHLVVAAASLQDAAPA